jgi:hypothetical protein
MRNNKRVRFFRRLIYFILVLLLFLPLILTSFLSIRLISRIERVEQRLGELEAKAAAVPVAALSEAALPLESKEPALDDGLPNEGEASPDVSDDPVPEESSDPQVPLGPEDEAAAPPPAPEAPSVLQPAPLTGR